MSYKKKSLILSLILLTIIQVLLYINNSQKTSFRYFVWDIQEVKIGKLISISFVSGLIISSILNQTINSNLLSNYIKDEEENEEKVHNKKFVEEEDDKSNLEIPPQRDLRDTQPTISVNYRVIKNTIGSNSKYNQNLSNDREYKDDWIEDDKEW